MSIKHRLSLEVVLVAQPHIRLNIDSCLHHNPETDIKY